MPSSNDSESFSMSGDENWLDEIESSATDCVAHNGAWGALEFETGGGQGPCDIEGGDLKNASKSSPRSPNGCHLSHNVSVG